MAQRDEIALRVEEALDRRFVSQEADGFALQPGDEFGRNDMGGQELRTGCGECRIARHPFAQLLLVPGNREFGRGRFRIEREERIDLRG